MTLTKGVRVLNEGARKSVRKIGIIVIKKE